MPERLLADLLPGVMIGLIGAFLVVVVTLGGIQVIRGWRARRRRTILGPLRELRLAISSGEDPTGSARASLAGIPRRHRLVVRTALVEDLHFLRGSTARTITDILTAWGTREQWLRGARSLLPSRRAEAARALGFLHDRRLVGVLLPLLRDPSAVVRVAAAESLGRLGAPQSAMRILESVDQDNGRSLSAWVAIDTVGSIPHVEPYLRIGLGHQSPDVREVSARIIREHGHVHTAQALRSAARAEADPRVLAEMILGLGVVGDHRDIDPLTGWLAPRHPSPIRRAALASLVRIGEESAVLPLVFDDDPSVARSAARLLADSGDTGLQLLLDLVDPPAAAQHHAAVAMLGRRGRTEELAQPW